MALRFLIQLIGGASWKSINLDAVPSESVKPLYAGPRIDHDPRLMVTDNTLYFISPSSDNLRIFGLSTDGNVLIPIQDTPTLESEPQPRGLIRDSDETRRILTAYFTENSIKSDTLAVSGDVFYLEFRRTLFKWRLGDPAWTNTGLVDTPERNHCR